MTIEYLSETTNLLYAELLQQCWRAAPDGRGISFVTKARGEQIYWYLQHTLGKQKSQYYLGVDSPELRAKIDAEKALWQTAQPESRKRQSLVAMLTAGGTQTVGPLEAKVLALLERIGVFSIGGVLVGSHAFRLYQNLLGIRWPSPATQTQDIDVAGDNRFLVGLPNEPIHLEQALLASGLGFFPIPALNHHHPSTSFSLRGQELQVDILTPLPPRYPPDRGPIPLKSLQTAAHPVAFLEYLLTDAQSAVIPARAGILVNLPAPARFALHKLVLSQRRPAAMQTKARKDLTQASLLLQVLLEDRPGDVILALEAILPGKFTKQLDAGIQQLDAPLRDELTALLPASP